MTTFELSLPHLASASLNCGAFHNAEDHFEGPLNLNEYLVSRPSSTFFVRAQGESMTGAGIFPGDILIIDRSITPRSQHIVVAFLDGEFTLKRLIKNETHPQEVILQAENPDYPPIHVRTDNDERDFQIWGVAIHCLHKLL